MKKTKKQLFFISIKLGIAFICSVFLFTFLFFPYEDLGDLVCTKVAQGTNDQVFCRVDSMGLSLFPTPSLKFSGLTVEGKSIPKLEMGSLKLRPNIFYLLSMRVGAGFSIENFLKANIKGSIKLDSFNIDPKKETENSLNLQIESLDLKSVSNLFDFPLDINGAASASLDSKFDLHFIKQPEGQFELRADKKINIKRVTIKPLKNLTLTDLNFNQLLIKGQMGEGTLTVETIQLGDGKDDLFLLIKGRVDFEFKNNGRAISPVVGGIDLRSQLRVNKRVEKKDSFISSAIEVALMGTNVQKSSSETVYTFRIRKAGAFGMPELAPLDRF